MLPDVVDDFQLQYQHGPGVETIFYSSYVFFTKLSGAAALGISTLSLESVLGRGIAKARKDLEGVGRGGQSPPMSLKCILHSTGWGDPTIRTPFWLFTYPT